MKLTDIRRALRDEDVPVKKKAQPTKSFVPVECERCKGLFHNEQLRVVDVLAGRYLCGPCDEEDLCDFADCDQDAAFSDVNGKLCHKHNLKAMERTCRMCGGSGGSTGPARCPNCGGEGVE